MNCAKDIELWDKLKKEIQPLKVDVVLKDLPPRLKVRYKFVKTLPLKLDLHRMTIQEAYLNTLQFVEKHYKIGTKSVQIITGKGREGQGAIRLEFMGWLETPIFKQYIRKTQWTNDKGAVDLWLKKSK